MEFASEMAQAIRASLRIAELPITYPRGERLKLNSVPDAWRHLRLMLMYSPTALYVIRYHFTGSRPGPLGRVTCYPVIFAGGLFMSLGVRR